MKTNVNMIRKMGDFQVSQRTKDGMFNATTLLKQWNKFSGQKKEVTKFFELDNTKEFINVLMGEENLHTYNLAYVKSKASRGENAGTWMHPYLFIKFAMWINPKFEYQVIKFVHDQLIEFRHSAGDLYIGLSSSASKFSDVDYREIAKALNWIVFNRHEKGIRQSANPNQLKEMIDIQKQLEFAIDMQYIRSFSQLLTEMRKLWHKKYVSLSA